MIKCRQLDTSTCRWAPVFPCRHDNRWRMSLKPPPGNTNVMFGIIGMDQKCVVMNHNSSCQQLVPFWEAALQKEEEPLCCLHLIFGNQLPLRRLAVSVIIIWWVTASAAPVRWTYETYGHRLCCLCDFSLLKRLAESVSLPSVPQ